MSTLKVSFVGDASKLKSDIREITALGTKAEAETAAAVKVAEAEKQAARKRSAEEMVTATRNQLEEQKRLVKAAGDEDLVQAKADLESLKMLLKGRTEQVRQAAQAEKQATKEVSEANRALRQAEAAEERAWRDEQTRLARQATAEMRKLQPSAGRGRGAGGDAGGGSDIDSSATGQIVQLGALWAAVKKAASVINQAAATIEEANRKLIDASLAANERNAGNIESLRLGGLSYDDAQRVAAAGARGTGRYRLSDLDSALSEFGRTATAKVDPQAMERVLQLAGRQSLSGAMAALGQGFGAEESVSMAESYYRTSRGGSLSADQAREGMRLRRGFGGQFRDQAKLMAFLAAADETGTDLGGVDAENPFLNQRAGLFDSYTRRLGKTDGLTRSTDTLTATRNSLEGLRQQMLVDQDQTMAVSAAESQAAAEARRLANTATGSTLSRSVQTAADVVGAGTVYDKVGTQSNPLYIKSVDVSPTSQ